MANQKLKLMISSRSETKFPLGDEDGTKLSSIRKDLKKEIEDEKFFWKSLVTVWISEKETESGIKTAWDACIKQSHDCDLFIALYNGEAGGQPGAPNNASGIGICHAEFEAAHSGSPGKVRVVSLLNGSENVAPDSGPDLDFHNAIQNANLLDARDFADVNDLKSRVKELVRELVLQLAHEGAGEVKKSGPNTGGALNWSRLNFSDRQKNMVNTLRTSLLMRPKAYEDEDEIFVPISGVDVLFKASGIPAALTVSAAREMVGQPFLRDHEYSSLFKGKRGGPVHLIACQKTVSENQAMSLLGFPDATIVGGNFGVYVADNIQKIQLCLIAKCRDSASTKHGLQRLFEWLDRTGENEYLAARARSRKNILQAIRQEVQ